jgi:predicted TIM-barrel fold metal-dependent hydrolase
LGEPMNLPVEVGIIDTMIGFPTGNLKEKYEFITSHVKDAQSKNEFEFPAEYMFKAPPDKEIGRASDPVGFVLNEMDRWNIQAALVGVESAEGREAVTRYPDRFIPSGGTDPNRGVEGIRELVAQYEQWGIRAVGVSPLTWHPQVAINDKTMYPIYTKCVELGLPLFCTVGVPGPRVPMACQYVGLVDEVMYDFPDLVFVTRHGCEPWADLIVKLMIKWPNLYYSTSAFAPKYYPQEIVDYANTRGADKIIYGGYFPMGLSLERIMAEMPNVGFKEDVWPKFLRGNAARVLGLSSEGI